MRIYFAADAARLRRLRDGAALVVDPRVPASGDEVDEFDAMTSAMAPGCAVVAADVDAATAPVEMATVAAFHVDLDGTGDLAWFAAQELDDVIDVLDA